MDMTATAVDNARRLGIDCLVCLGGGGTQKNALHLNKAGGINVLTLPKTIDNDVAETDVSFGFDTAMAIATEAIDRLHSTATSHNRMIICEVMGHHTGWLALGAGMAGGADIVLIPEIPYDLDVVAEHLFERRRSGKRFSIIAVSEGAVSKEEAARLARQEQEKGKEKEKHNGGESDRKRDRRERRKAAPEALAETANAENQIVHEVQEPMASRIARRLQHLTGTEARLTSLGHVQRGGSPTATDRMLCTLMGTKAAELLAEGVYNVMVAVRGNTCVPIPLEDIAGKRKSIPFDHPWLASARLVGTCLGDKES